jgi:hypothetical protein
MISYVYVFLSILSIKLIHFSTLYFIVYIDVTMTTFTQETAEHLIMARYYSDQIREDTSIDELYNILYQLPQEELSILNNNSELTTKQMLAARYIEKSIEKFYNYIREIQHSRRRVTEERKTQIFYEKTYWHDIASGVPENEAKESLNLFCS